MKLINVSVSVSVSGALYQYVSNLFYVSEFLCCCFLSVHAPVCV